MRFSFTLLAGAAVLVSGQHNSNSNQGYIEEICLPRNSTGLPDMNSPCNGLQAVQFECMYGPATGLKYFYSQYNVSNPNSNYGADIPDDAQSQDKRTQQICACESQMFDLLNGCISCQKGHGSNDIGSFFGRDYIASMSSSYCVASATPTLDLSDFLFSYAGPSSLPSTAAAAYSSAQTSAFSDHIGSKTNVNLYFTPSVTGTKAWMVAEQTGAAGTSGPGTFATVVTSSGQIVATASRGAGTRETAAAMGIVGLMGVVAML